MGDALLDYLKAVHTYNTITLDTLDTTTTTYYYTKRTVFGHKTEVFLDSFKTET